MAARVKSITERGALCVKIVFYSVTAFFIIVSAIPLLWLISSSMKDDTPIYRFPPTWVPAMPRSVKSL